jgi:hypothetical protein
MQKGVAVPCGVRDTVLCNSSVDGRSFVGSCTLLNGVTVMANAVVAGCGVVQCVGETTFGNGVELPLGLDGPGRMTAVFASMTVDEAAAVATHTADPAAYKTFLTSLLGTIKSNRTVVRYASQCFGQYAATPRPSITRRRCVVWRGSGRDAASSAAPRFRMRCWVRTLLWKPVPWTT